MTSAERFQNFYKALQESNPIWFDGLKVPFGKKDFEQAAMKVWLILHSENKISKNMDWMYARNLMGKTLPYVDDKHVPKPTVIAEVQISDKALTGEARDKRIKELLEVIQKAPILNAMPRPSKKEVAAEGGWRIDENRKLFPNDKAEDVIKKELHLQWIRRYHDKITGEKLPDWLPEKEWLETLED